MTKLIETIVWAHSRENGDDPVRCAAKFYISNRKLLRIRLFVDGLCIHEFKDVPEKFAYALTYCFQLGLEQGESLEHGSILVTPHMRLEEKLLQIS